MKALDMYSLDHSNINLNDRQKMKIIIGDFPEEINTLFINRIKKDKIEPFNIMTDPSKYVEDPIFWCGVEFYYLCGNNRLEYDFDLNFIYEYFNVFDWEYAMKYHLKKFPDELYERVIESNESCLMELIKNEKCKYIPDIIIEKYFKVIYDKKLWNTLIKYKDMSYNRYLWLYDKITKNGSTCINFLYNTEL